MHGLTVAVGQPMAQQEKQGNRGHTRQKLSQMKRRLREMKEGEAAFMKRIEALGSAEQEGAKRAFHKAIAYAETEVKSLAAEHKQ
jgi:hypothetical protein